MKNISTGNYKDANQRNDIHHGTVYITIHGVGDQPDTDWKVELEDGSYHVTDLASNKIKTH